MSDLFSLKEFQDMLDRLEDRIDKRLDKFDDKFDKLDDKIQHLAEHTVKNTASLDEHMRRTEAVEKIVELLDEKVELHRLMIPSVTAVTVAPKQDELDRMAKLVAKFAMHAYVIGKWVVPVAGLCTLLWGLLRFALSYVSK